MQLKDCAAVVKPGEQCGAMTQQVQELLDRTMGTPGEKLPPIIPQHYGGQGLRQSGMRQSTPGRRGVQPPQSAQASQALQVPQSSPQAPQAAAATTPQLLGVQSKSVALRQHPGDTQGARARQKEWFKKEAQAALQKDAQKATRRMIKSILANMPGDKGWEFTDGEIKRIKGRVLKHCEGNETVMASRTWCETQIRACLREMLGTEGWEFTVEELGGCTYSQQYQQAKQEDYINVNRIRTRVFVALNSIIDRECSSWNLSAAQKKIVVSRAMQIHCQHPFALLTGSEKGTRVSWVKDGLKAVVKEECSEFICPICRDVMNPLDKESSIWMAKKEQNENWNKVPCGHAFCQGCIKQWCETTINGMEWNIRCPGEGCAFQLWSNDVRPLISTELFKKWQERRNGTYLEHLKESVQGESSDPDLTAWLRENSRPCPQCHVIVSRAYGCSDMRCVCGCHFCYKCGFKNCKCRRGKGHKPNAWDKFMD